jgi:SAM-dependent methyltransferase
MRSPEELVPPEELLPNQHRDTFIESGRQQLSLLVERCRLRPHKSVLDMGCGPGRMAVALVSYLTEEGSYEGIDVSPERIEWCASNITSRYPNFRFQVADVYSRRYNPRGTVRGADYRFPYTDERFDLVFLFSVFTHMLADDMENYLAEIARTLKIGGRCLATFLLLNDESQALIDSDRTRRDPGKNALEARFEHDFGNHRVSDLTYPEQVVAYDEQFVRAAYVRHGLTIADPIIYGWWPGRDPRHGPPAVLENTFPGVG